MTEAQIIDRKKKRIAKQSMPLLLSFYANIASEIRDSYLLYGLIPKNTIFNNAKCNKLLLILQRIYKNVRNEFEYYERNKFNIANKKPFFTKSYPKCNEIKLNDTNSVNIDSLNDVISVYIDQWIIDKSNEHADYIIDSTFDKINFYVQKSGKLLDAENTKLKNSIGALAAKITAGLIAGTNLSDVNNWKKEKLSLEKRLTANQFNPSKKISKILYNQFSNNVVKQKSELDTDFEVGYAETEIRTIETERMASSNNLITGGIFSGLLFLSVAKKVWDATLDSRTRWSHALANGQEKSIFEEFEVRDPQTGVVEYGNPRSDTLSIGNKANCRCVIIMKYGN